MKEGEIILKKQSEKEADISFVKYEEIKRHLVYAVNKYCNLESEQKIKMFIERQKHENESGYANRFIVVPNGNITDKIKKDYLGYPSVIDGEEVYEPDFIGRLGSIEDLETQYDSIKDIAMWMLMSNRISKKYKRRAELNGEGERQEEGANTNAYKIWLSRKNIAFCALITCLNVLNFDNSEDNPRFKINYGMKKDLSKEEGTQDAFIIDVPYTGQISIHLGSEKNLNENLRIIKLATKTALRLKAKNKLISQVAERKKQKIKNGLSEEEAHNQVKEELNAEYKKEKNKIMSIVDIGIDIPEYEGRLLETSSAIPLEMGTSDKNIQAIYNNFKASSSPTNNEIAQFINEVNDDGTYKYNPREIHYLAVKLGWNADQIKFADRVSKSVQDRSRNHKLNELRRLRKAKMTEEQQVR